MALRMGRMGTGHNITFFVNSVFTGYLIPFRMTGPGRELEVSIPKHPKARVTALTAVTTRVKSMFTSNGMPIGV